MKMRTKSIFFFFSLVSILLILPSSAQDENGIFIHKMASTSTVSPGDQLYYIIFYGNGGSNNLTGVVITESYPPGVELISSTPDPDPGTNNRWTIGNLGRENFGIIILTMQVSQLQDLEFFEDGRVVGEGFTNIRDSLSSRAEPSGLTNEVTIDSDQTGSTKATASVTFRWTELNILEHGSGRYENDEQLRLRTENRSITMERKVLSEYEKTSFRLYNNRTVECSSRWTEIARAKNWATGASMSEAYRYATSIDRKSRMFLDENESVMNIESEFNGSGHIGFLKAASDSSDSDSSDSDSSDSSDSDSSDSDSSDSDSSDSDSSDSDSSDSDSSDSDDAPMSSLFPFSQAPPHFQSREDYLGSFNIIQSVDEYGSSISSDSSASGEGMVRIDKSIDDAQRDYESGTGTYSSEEMIESNTKYIAKDLSLVHAPINQSLTDNTNINASVRWKEGMYSRIPGESYMGEEYTSLEYLNKSMVAAGLNNMDTAADFLGRSRYRTVLEDGLDSDELYEGNYSIDRRMQRWVVSEYDQPHLNVTTTAAWIAEAIHPGIEGQTVAIYAIRVKNDGNSYLGPIYVRDIFPPGSVFIHPSSVRSEELTDRYVNWTLTHLSPGDVSTIILYLNVTKALHWDVSKHHPADLLNRVEACGAYNGSKWVCASSTMSVIKTAEPDPQAWNIIRYRIDINNSASDERRAIVTDSLPEGMVLLNATVPVASYENGTITWKLEDLKPFEIETIEYRVKALYAGRFINSARVDPQSSDRLIEQPVFASVVIEVAQPANASLDLESKQAIDGRSDLTWQPPNWSFEYIGYPTDITCDEICSISPQRSGGDW